VCALDEVVDGELPVGPRFVLVHALKDVLVGDRPAGLFGHLGQLGIGLHEGRCLQVPIHEYQRTPQIQLHRHQRPFAAVEVQERVCSWRVSERAVEGVVEAVVLARQRPSGSVPLRHLVAAVAAAVHVGAEGAVEIPDDHHRGLSGVRREEVAGAAQRADVSDVEPLVVEDGFLFDLQDVRIPVPVAGKCAALVDRLVDFLDQIVTRASHRTPSSR
jgi:hypothetical protein